MSQQICIRSFKWGTLYSFRSRGCKNIQGQSWRMIKILLVQPTLGALVSSLPDLAIFCSTFNFDLKYFCSLFTYKNVQYHYQQILRVLLVQRYHRRLPPSSIKFFKPKLFKLFRVVLNNCTVLLGASDQWLMSHDPWNIWQLPAWRGQ